MLSNRGIFQVQILLERNVFFGVIWKLQSSEGELQTNKTKERNLLFIHFL
jgi:hypothetical protein